MKIEEKQWLLSKRRNNIFYGLNVEVYFQREDLANQVICHDPHLNASTAHTLCERTAKGAVDLGSNAKHKSSLHLTRLPLAERRRG